MADAMTEYKRVDFTWPARISRDLPLRAIVL